MDQLTYRERIEELVGYDDGRAGRDVLHLLMPGDLEAAL
jgi:hypothetical protein